jgi:hypothetical protein
MTTSTPTTTAVGGRRQVPVPDPIARDYLVLGLRLDQHVPGTVDGYFGPADLKAQVDLEQLVPPVRLAEDAAELLDRVAAEAGAADRAAWLTGQLRAVAARARALAGEQLPYEAFARECFDWAPVRRDEALFDQAAAEIDRLLPGPGPIADRMAAWDDGFTIPRDRIVPVGEWLVATFRDRVARTIGLPDDEAIRIRLVRGQPWTGYNWYDGGRRSRFDVNTDLPLRSAELVHVAAHEAYPGHHTENAWKETELVEHLGRLEASILLINTPESLISEGLADLGHELVSPASSEPDLLVEIYDRAGLPIAEDPAASRDAAERSVALAPYRRRLAESRVNAALMRHADGASHDEVLAWLERVGRFAPPIAAKRLEFIEHPLWRTYVFVYHEGEALLRRWLEAVPLAGRHARFGRLLREQLSPSAIAAEIEAGPVRAS